MRKLEIKITFEIPDGANILALLRLVKFFSWCGILQRAGGKIEHKFENCKKLTLENIEKVVSKKTGVLNILENTRKRQTVEARMIGMWLAVNKLGLTGKATGIYFANRDHATVLHACKQVENLKATDKRFAAQLAEIELSLT